MTGIGDAVPLDRPGDMQRLIADLRREMRENAAARTLNRATIDAAPGNGIRTSDFDGTSATDVGTVGNYFGGDGMVVGRAVFRAGTIPPSALSTAVTAGGIWTTATNFPLAGSSAMTAVTSTSVAVPSGASSAVISVTGRLYAMNTTTSSGFSLSTPTVAVSGGSPTTGNVLPKATAASTAEQTTSLLTVTLSSLPVGGTITITLNAATSGAAWTATSGNVAELSGTVLWLR